MERSTGKGRAYIRLLTFGVLNPILHLAKEMLIVCNLHVLNIKRCTYSYEAR